MNWIPQKHEIVKDDTIKHTLHETGYMVAGNIGASNLAELTALYKDLHKFNSARGGMFYSIYSNDIDYRKKVHNTIGEVLQPVYDSLFYKFKSVINSFIVKIPGPESEFILHQDSSGLDELQYSSLSVWIPLQETNLNNGCLCVIPKSHKMSYPYRGISMPSHFHNIENEVKRYLVPIDLKAGDILLFDNRLMHYSPPNLTNSDRIVVMSGLFPPNASIEMCYRDTSLADSPIEVYQYEDDYLLTNTTFFHDCTCRPVIGTKIKEVYDLLPDWSNEDFLTAVAKANLKETNIPGIIAINTSMHIISEPV